MCNKKVPVFVKSEEDESRDLGDILKTISSASSLTYILGYAVGEMKSSSAYKRQMVDCHKILLYLNWLHL